MKISKRLNDEISIGKTETVLLLIAISVAVIAIIFAPSAFAQVENMTITSDTSSVHVGVSENIKFTVTTTCTPPPGEVCAQIVTPVSGASVQLSGAASGSNTTNDMGEAIITINATSPGDITATASKDGSSASTVIKAYALPQLKITADPSTVYAGTSRDVNFTVTEDCPQGTDVCTQGSLVSGASVQLTGAFSGGGTTGTDGRAVITINANSAGTITATARKAGYTSDSTTITAKGQPQLNLTANVDALYVNVVRNVTFTVNHPCGTHPDDGQCTGDALVPDPGATITISGVASGSGVTALNAAQTTGMTASITIPINATAPGNVIVTAQKEGYIDDVINIPADYLPVAVFTTKLKNYSVGDTVDFTLTNIGPVTISPDVLQIRNGTNSRWVFSSTTLGLDPLAPGQSVNISWKQKDNNGNQVPPAAYRARIVYSYHNNSFVNSTDWFNILDCINKMYAPVSANSTVGEEMTFHSGDLTNTSKAWDVTWYINGTEVYKETGVTTVSSYTNDHAAEGVWNVTAVARSGCNTITWSIVWTVTALPECGNVVFEPKSFTSYLGQSVKFQSFNLTNLTNLTKTPKIWNVTWYINGTQVKNETGVTRFSNYTNTSAALGVWNVTIIADSGCISLTKKWIWTVSNVPPPTPPCCSGGGGSGGGGGGGGGITTAETFTNILKFERHDADLIRGSAVTYTFSLPEFSIYQVLVIGKENEGQVAMRLEHLADTSALVSRLPAGIIYANENVWLGSKRIEYVVIRFRVNNSWITANKLEKTDIKLLKFDNGWKKLNTKEINSDSIYTYFESRTPDLSSFAVSGLKDDTQGAQDLLATAGDTNTGDGNTGNESETNVTGTSKESPGIGTVAGFGVISAAYLLMIGRRKIDQEDEKP